MAATFGKGPFSVMDIDPEAYDDMLLRHGADIAARPDAQAAPAPGAPQPVASLATSADGIDFIKRWEGLRLKTYKDGAGHATIGYGHKLATPDEYPNGITPQQADDLLNADLRRTEQIIRRKVKVPLTQNQLDALAAMTFNVPAVMTQSKDSHLLSKLNSGDYDGAAQQMSRWNHIRKNGELQVDPGLSRRRAAEQDIFRNGAYAGP